MGGRGGGSGGGGGLIQVPVFDEKAIADLDIADAYQDALDSRPNSSADNPWVSVTRMRTALAVRGWSRERQDRELLRFVRERKGILNPESNQKVLSPDQRNDGIMMGNERKDIFMIKR